MDTSVLSRYEKIANDIAHKVADGVYPEGEKLRGRSTLAGLYKVSPETMRKAFALLASQQVVEVRHGSGVFVVSAQNARDFLRKTAIRPRFRRKLDELAELIAQRRELDRQIDHCIMDITRFASDRFNADADEEQRSPEDPASGHQNETP